jgi:hypothetical protein
MEDSTHPYIIPTSPWNSDRKEDVNSHNRKNEKQTDKGTKKWICCGIKRRSKRYDVENVEQSHLVYRHAKGFKA